MSSTARQTKPNSSRAETEAAFLDAAERLLIEVGYAGISTRRLAEEAGANPGLVHYYFGSMEEVFVRALERFTDRLIARQREMYAAESNFLRVEARDMYLTLPKTGLSPHALSWRPHTLQAMPA